MKSLNFVNRGQTEMDHSRESRAIEYFVARYHNGPQARARMGADYSECAKRCNIVMDERHPNRSFKAALLSTHEVRAMQMMAPTNTLSKHSLTRGSGLVKPGWIERLDIAMGAWPIASLATIERRDGDPVRMATVDVSQARAVIARENTDSAYEGHTDVTFGLTEVHMDRFKARQVHPMELDTDAPDFIDQMPTIFGAQLGGGKNYEWTKTVKAAATNVNSASAGVVTGDDLESMLAVISGNLIPNVTFMFSSSAFIALHRAKDGQGAFLFHDGTFGGFPYRINTDLDSIATGNVPVLAGDFSKLLVVEDPNVTILANEEALIHNGQILWVGYHRSAASPLNTGAFAKLTIS